MREGTPMWSRRGRMIRAQGPGSRRWVVVLAVCVALVGACSPSGQAGSVTSATASPAAGSLVAAWLGAEATEADLAVFADAFADGGTCALDTEEAVRLGATYYRRLSEAVVAIGQMDVPTLAAVARVLRDEYDAVASGVEMVPLPEEFETLDEENMFESDRPFSEYKDALRGMLEPYGVALYVPDPSDATMMDRFRPLDLSTPESMVVAKYAMLSIMRGFAMLPADAVRAVDFDVYVGDVVMTFDGENEASGYARRPGGDGRGAMALDGAGGMAFSAVQHEWAHLLYGACDHGEWGDVYFDAHYPAQLPSYGASETLAAASNTGLPYVLPTIELPAGAVTTVENLMVEELPDGVAVVELTNYALRNGEGFPVHMEVVTAPPWGSSPLGVGGVPATEYLRDTPTITRHSAVTAARLDEVAPGAGEMGVIAIMLEVLTNHAALSGAWDSPDAALWDEALTYAGHDPSTPATSQPPRD